MKNIVFFDIDGTIINETTHKTPESAIKAIEMARDNGNLLFINTGRTPAIISPSLRDLGFDGFICGCGTYIEYNNKVLLSNSIGNELSKEIVKALREFNIEGVLEGLDTIYFDSMEKIHHPDIKRIIEAQANDNFNLKFSLEDPSINIAKFVIFLNDSSNFEGFYNRFKDKFSFIQRADTFYEIIPLGYSKATGIEYITNLLNIPFENTYGIGDSTNDLPMLTCVKNSIAMGNSNPKLFDNVSFVTTDIDDDGIYNALKHYNLI